MTSPATVPNAILQQLSLETGVVNWRVAETLQILWSGYGSIVRLQAAGESNTCILKLIQPPTNANHPRGWNSTASHERKLRSYDIEATWYQRYANLCTTECKVPTCIASGTVDNTQWIALEDLTQHYPSCPDTLPLSKVAVCLHWLAEFHAEFLHRKPEGLWPIGTYWHLDTREDEFNAMPSGSLKSVAGELDRRLNSCEYQTIVHGDAKIANFCFSENLNRTAAVDFQYVGGGVGIKDVAYFLGSCLDEHTIRSNETELLNIYFNRLEHAIAEIADATVALYVVSAWRDLYAIAWTDFYRFLEGWMPGHRKINSYTKQLADTAYRQLQG